jgi:hypothetical protein
MRCVVKATEWFPVMALVQGVYYLVTGIWPLVSPKSFQAVTGPKHDLWLVKTVGVLVATIGAVLTLAGLRRRTTLEIPALAIGSAAGLAAIDTVYAAKGRISPIYFADAAAEAALIAGWLFVRRRGRAVPLVAEVFRRGDATERPAAEPTARITTPAGEALGI